MRCSSVLCRGGASGSTPVAHLVGTYRTSTLNPVEQEASEIAHQLVQRHRQRQQVDWTVGLPAAKYVREPVVDALAGYGKAAVMTKLAHATKVNAMGTADLLMATDEQWDILAPGKKFSAAFLTAKSAYGLPAARRLLSRNPPASPSKEVEKNFPTAFDALFGRYSAVVPDNGHHAKGTVAGTFSWRVNMPSSSVRGASLRSLSGWMEQQERLRRWYRTRSVMFPKLSCASFGGAEKVPADGPQSIEGALSTLTGRNFHMSSVFRRYCLDFGSGTIRDEAFMLDPTMYYVLSNLNTTDVQSLTELKAKAKVLSEEYNTSCHSVS
ncbi:hypothetical protein TRVL_04939 [Trypanosoma vivax]|nr:hypothetical protein TRVL_04939 [Trypanosoma vivax]